MVNRGRPERSGTTAQAAVEYLTTYGWAILIIVAVLAFLYVFAISSSSLAPQRCLFNSGAYCNDIIFGSNSLGSHAVLLLTNSQSYAISNPTFSLNLENKGNVSGTCSPSYVLPGGAMICSATLPSTYGQGTLVTGSAYITGTPCVSGSSTQSCSGSSVQTYSGSVNVHVQQPASSNTISITLTPMNLTQGATGGEDPLFVKVLLLGYPLQGASVNFAAPSAPFVTIAPAEATTNSTGGATSYISSTTVGNVLVTASFAGYTANAIVDFTPPLYITYTAANIVGFSSSSHILDINNIEYTVSQLPLTVAVGQGSRQAYSFAGTVTNTKGNTRIANPQASGCGVTGQNNTFIATYNCTVSGVYTTQYLLTLQSSSPCTINFVPGPSEWENEGSVVAISTSAGSAPADTRCIWSTWSGSGSGSTSSSSQSASVTMRAPITETAVYTTQYLLTVKADKVDGDVAGTAVIDLPGGATATTHYYTPGDTYKVTGTPDSGYAWVGWLGTGSGSETNIPDRTFSGTMPSNPITETATFKVGITSYYDNDNCVNADGQNGTFNVNLTGYKDSQTQGACFVGGEGAGGMPVWADVSVYKSYDCVSSGNSRTPTDCQVALFKAGDNVSNSDGDCIGYLNETGGGGSTYTEIYMISGSSTSSPYGADGPC